MKWLLFLLIFTGCSQRGTVDQPPPSFAHDAAIAPEVSPHVCQPELIDVDFNNCGSCGFVCDTANTDQCRSGICLCGSNAPCGTLEDCRGGRCIPVDLDGPICEFDQECGAGHACIEAHCSFVECVPEVCDGIDNDCDGLIDNQGMSPLSQFCIGDMPASEAYNLPCKTGVRVCDYGVWTECNGDVAPTPEIGIFGCDGIDNDCDGCVDGIEVGGYCESRIPASNFDVMFLIDVSGSMGPKIEMVKQAVTLFSSTFSNDSQFRWGIIKIPAGIDGDPGLDQDLTDFETFRIELNNLTIFGSLEPQWAAVAQAADGTLGVSWAPDSTRILILFTDEPGQSGHTFPPYNEQTMCDSLTHGEVLVSVIQSPFESDFDDCAHQVISLANTGFAGSGDDCSNDGDCSSGEICDTAICVTEQVIELANDLRSVISDPCETP